MQIVIDIPEDVYKRTVFYREFRDLSDCVATIKALEKATPLPKGHGRLIDADALKKYIDDCDCCVGCEDESYGCADKCKCPDYLDEGMERIINNQPIIIEADKEG